MASTIKLKNGSGAPLASDLVAGEPALDLTNKRLYTEDSGGTVIEVGTNPTELQVDNINIDGNAITSTDTDGNITITPNGTGEVDISKVDIDGGTIDGVTIGGASAGAGTFTTITGSGDMNIDSGTLFVDASTNRVGVGTASPSAKLDIFDSATGNAELAGIELVNYDYGVGETGQAISIEGSVRNDGGGISPLGKIVFGKDSDYSSAANRDGNIQFYTNLSNSVEEAMRIDSSGNVGINTSPQAFAKLQVKTATDRNISVFDNANGATICAINDLGGSVTTRIAGSPIVMTGGGGSGSEHVRIDSSGLSFDNGSNHLDDYEEGTFTPGFTDNSGNTGSSSPPTGIYTKIGNTVYFRLLIGNLNTTGLVGTDDLYLTGLPFTSNNFYSVGAPRLDHVSFTDYAIAQTRGTETRMVLLDITSGSNDNVIKVNDLTTSVADIDINGFYFTDS